MTMQLREYQQRTDNDQEKVCESIEDIIEAYEAKIREKNNVLG